VNEDAFLDQSGIGLWVVADGMGGHSRGDMASRAVVGALAGLPRPESLDDLAEMVRVRLGEANRRVRQEAAGYGADSIIGSTVVALLVFKRRWRCLWAGDSRAYLLRDGRLHQITRDHNVAQQLVAAGELSPDQAVNHPASNRLTRAIGAQADLLLEECSSVLRDGDAFLLCTDGLNKEVSDIEIAEVLEGFDCADASRELLDLTLERGARDNVTVAVVRFEATTGFGDLAPERTETPRPPRFQDHWTDQRDHTSSGLGP
jgi:serine/threonine protein phosphatase PrpC